ncbi:urease accessory protein UreD [Cognatishimia sp. F0-27]|uniref:urease accessory protein UreD n=1 Tax=Cognatishimia sp. F0-27 TaxID=2816855 RepID=UPI001D0C04D2|nr:urease accessory protein UreD [Cognatishimia sp. F0-27]MCC1491986.1 urease accessory protein UreD [Cognatishimia sp. F0-27]
MTSHAALTVRPPRAHGQVAIAAKSLGPARSGLSHLYQNGCARVLTTPDDKRIDGILINTAGGLTGGDSIRIHAKAEAGAHLRLTTQAAERAYRATGATEATVSNSLRLDAGARLDWLPQETILFDHAALRRTLRVDMAEDATALIVEPVLFGRLAMREQVQQARFADRVSLTRGGTRLFHDATTLSGAIDTQLDKPAIANGARAMALLVYAAPDAANHVDRLRSMLPETAGVSLAADRLLVGRFLASDGFDLRRALIPALEHLAGGALPRSWRL